MYEGMSGVVLSGLTDRGFVESPAWYPIVPADQNVSSWVTRRQWKQTSVLIHYDWWTLLD